MNVKLASPTVRSSGFRPEVFFRRNGSRQSASAYRNKQIIFFQGDPGAEVLYIHKGRVKLTVLSRQGKEATIGLLADGDFFGEECLATDQACRSATAVAMSDCSVYSIGREEMAGALNKKHAFANLF